MELHDELYFSEDPTLLDVFGSSRWDQSASSLCSLGDCIDFDNNPRNPEVEARSYHAYVVGNKWTRVAVPDATSTPELSVTVPLTGKNLHAKVLPESR